MALLCSERRFGNISILYVWSKTCYIERAIVLSLSYAGNVMKHFVTNDTNRVEVQLCVFVCNYNVMKTLEQSEQEYSTSQLHIPF